MEGFSSWTIGGWSRTSFSPSSSESNISRAFTTPSKVSLISNLSSCASVEAVGDDEAEDGVGAGAGAGDPKASDRDETLTLARRIFERAEIVDRRRETGFCFLGDGAVA